MPTVRDGGVVWCEVCEMRQQSETEVWCGVRCVRCANNQTEVWCGVKYVRCANSQRRRCGVV